MAKNKVINTVLNLRDNMSGGLLKAAQNAKKSSDKIDNSMIQSTRKVIAFKNKAVSAMQEFAKKSVLAAGAAVGGLAAAFVALDGATEEYRVNQGKLLTAFAGTVTGAQGARTAYNELYQVIGDISTATEAAQALSTLAQSQQDVTKWTRVAAGVVGKFGDGISINSLFQDIDETAVSSSVTGALADTLNWLNISEDEFNSKLEATGTTAGRTTLILDTLTAAYGGYADAFYQNNEQMVKSRAYQTQVNNTLAKLGTASQTAKNGVMQLLGAQEDGSFRAGSALEWLNDKATQFSDWVAGLDLDGLSTQFDQRFAWAVEKGGQAFAWVQDNGDTIIRVLKTIGAAWGITKVVQFTSSVVTAGKTLLGFVKTAGVLISANPVVLGIAAAVAAGALLIANWDKVKEFAAGLWQKIKDVFGGIKDAIVGAFDSAKDAVGSFFSWLDDKIESVPLLGQLYKGAKGIGSSVLDWLDGATRIQPRGNALGTSYWRGGLTRVNERGGEIINLPSGARIIPHDVSARMAGGPQVTVNVTVAGNVIGNRQYADELGETIVRKIIRAWDNV